MEGLNAKIAKAAVTGRLDRNPFMQDLLVQCLHRIEKEERGISSNRGRRSKSCSDAEVKLLADAALSLSILSGNQTLAKELGQKVTKITVKLEELAEHGLPNPALSLMFPSQLEQNFILVDQQFPRDDKMPARRLILAMDGTYLQKSLVQCPINQKVGLVGGCWSSQDDSSAFLDIGVPMKGIERAAVMMEFLTWDPCAYKQETFSVSAMPMSLSAPKTSEKETQTHAGNREAWHVLSIAWPILAISHPFPHSSTTFFFSNFSMAKFFLNLFNLSPSKEILLTMSKVLTAGAWLVKGIVMDGHHSHRYLKECLFGWFEKLDKAELQGMDFWRDVSYEDLPRHCLPRMPMRLCMHAGETIWCLPGPCFLADPGRFWLVFVDVVLSCFIFIIF